jgi:hypothetical protein
VGSHLLNETLDVPELSDRNHSGYPASTALGVVFGLMNPSFGFAIGDEGILMDDFPRDGRRI